MSSLESLRFDNQVLKRLPIDEDEQNYVRTVPGACFSRIAPSPVVNPVLVASSIDAVRLLDLSEEEIHRPEFAKYFSGNRILPGSETACHCYCGHQFGNFAGQLGDGTVVYLGEIVNRSGERWEVQLKGAGRTPYSRQGDGRKVLRSSLREFLCSEAMYYLGVPTTRASSCVTSDTFVERDMFYDGNVKMERASIVCRIAPTFLRFGSFEIFKTRDPLTARTGPSVGRVDILHQLLDYTIEMFYPEIFKTYSKDRMAQTLAFFKEISLRTARLVALWQCVGFCHGVLNTDNMSIVGVTIDYGPFGFLDRFDPGYICNKSDNGGRYAYGQQKSICKWNLKKLAEALSPCLPPSEVDGILSMYDEEFDRAFLHKMKQKLGLIRTEDDQDRSLVNSFLETMHKTGCDFTNGFRNLNKMAVPTSEDDQCGLQDTLTSLLDQCCSPQELLASMPPSMHQHNLRMFLSIAEQTPQLLAALGVPLETLRREQEKLATREKLKNTTPEDKRSSDEALWKEWLTEYRKRLLKEAKDLDNQGARDRANQERFSIMNQNNPKFVLRNCVAQRAIEAAEQRDYSEVERVLHLLKHPYEEMVELPSANDKRHCQSSPDDKAQKLEKTTASVGLVEYYCRPSLDELKICVT